MAHDTPRFLDPNYDEQVELLATVQVPDALLDKTGFDCIRATAHVDENLTALIDQLRAQQNAHMWAVQACTASDVERHENATRPTRILSYYGHRGSERTLLACGAISEWVAPSFAIGGYAVLARCFIANDYRDLGLYRIFVEHRVALCQKIWGSCLRGIHMSSAHERVWNCLGKPFSAGCQFLYIGDEVLVSSDPSAEDYRMRAFLAPSTALVMDLEGSVLRLNELGAEGRAVSASIQQYLGGTFPSNAGHRLHHLMEQVWPEHIPDWAFPLIELSDFCRSVLSDETLSTPA